MSLFLYNIPLSISYNKSVKIDLIHMILFDRDGRRKSKDLLYVDRYY